MLTRYSRELKTYEAWTRGWTDSFASCTGALSIPHKALNSLWFVRLEERFEHVHSAQDPMRRNC